MKVSFSCLLFASICLFLIGETLGATFADDPAPCGKDSKGNLCCYKGGKKTSFCTTKRTEAFVAGCTLKCVKGAPKKRVKTGSTRRRCMTKWEIPRNICKKKARCERDEESGNWFCVTPGTYAIASTFSINPPKPLPLVHAEPSKPEPVIVVN